MFTTHYTPENAFRVYMEDARECLKEADYVNALRSLRHARRYANKLSDKHLDLTIQAIACVRLAQR